MPKSPLHRLHKAESHWELSACCTAPRTADAQNHRRVCAGRHLKILLFPFLPWAGTSPSSPIHRPAGMHGALLPGAERGSGRAEPEAPRPGAAPGAAPWAGAEFEGPGPLPAARPGPAPGHGPALRTAEPLRPRGAAPGCPRSSGATVRTGPGFGAASLTGMGLRGWGGSRLLRVPGGAFWLLPELRGLGSGSGLGSPRSCFCFTSRAPSPLPVELAALLLLLLRMQTLLPRVCGIIFC